jgi:hypothetical protein
VFRTQSLLLVVLLLLTLGLAGCGEQMPTLPALPSAAEAQKIVCDALTSVNSSVASLSNLSPTSTVNEVKALRAQLDTWVQAIKAANQVLNRPNITELTTAYDNLALQINSLPDGQAIGATAEANIEAGVKVVQDAVAQARAALSCQ